MSEVAGSDSTTHAKGFWGVHTPFSPSRCPFFYGWMIVFAATLGSIFSIPGQTMGFTVFTDVLMKELGEAYLAALDQKTGEVKWKVPRILWECWIGVRRSGGRLTRHLVGTRFQVLFTPLPPVPPTAYPPVVISPTALQRMR